MRLEAGLGRPRLLSRHAAFSHCCVYLWIFFSFCKLKRFSVTSRRTCGVTSRLWLQGSNLPIKTHHEAAFLYSDSDTSRLHVKRTFLKVTGSQRLHLQMMKSKLGFNLDYRSEVICQVCAGRSNLRFTAPVNSLIHFIQFSLWSFSNISSMMKIFTVQFPSRI